MRGPSSNATFSVDFMRRPLQIAADPRVYKGSVFAHRRAALEKAREAEQVEYKEKNYRVGVIREQLNTFLPRVNAPRKVLHTNKSHFPPAKISSSSTYLPEIPSQSRSISGSGLNISIDKRTTKSFSAARFSPESTQNRANGRIFSKSAFQPTVATVKESFPVKVVVNFEREPPPDITERIRRRSRQVEMSQAVTPPSSSRSLYPIVNSAVQTDDNFDQDFEGLVKELANSALEMAMINLEAENTIRAVRKAAEAAEHKLRAVTRKQNIDSEDWKRKMIEKNNELESWKLQEATAREAQRLAHDTCEVVTRKTLENLQKIERNSKKSIGLDTRDMVLLEKKMVLVTAELEKDFFPWIFHRAERMFKNRVARSHLDHSMLNELHHRREMAKHNLVFNCFFAAFLSFLLASCAKSRTNTRSDRKRTEQLDQRKQIGNRKSPNSSRSDKKLSRKVVGRQPTREDEGVDSSDTNTRTNSYEKPKRHQNSNKPRTNIVSPQKPIRDNPKILKIPAISKNVPEVKDLRLRSPHSLNTSLEESLRENSAEISTKSEKMSPKDSDEKRSKVDDAETDEDDIR